MAILKLASLPAWQDLEVEARGEHEG
jgi:hypothetical protein